MDMSFMNDMGGVSGNIDPAVNKGAVIGGQVAPGAWGQFGSFMNKPLTQQLLLALAGSFDPKGFGGNMARALAPMVSAKAAATATNSDPAAVAKQLKEAANVVSKLHAIDKTKVPANFNETILGALDATPPLVENPTEPAAPQTTSEPVAAGVPSVARPDFSSMFVDPDLAAAMGPEMFQQLQGNRVAARAVSVDEQRLAADLQIQPARLRFMEAQARNLDSDAAARDWERSPEGIEARYRLGAAGVIESERAKKEEEIRLVDNTKKFIATNPDLSNKKLPGMPMSIGSMMMISATNAPAGTMFSNIWNSVLDYQASRERNAVEMQRIAQAKKDSTEYKVFAQIQENAESLRKMNMLHDPSEYDLTNEEDRVKMRNDSLLGLVKTPGMVQEMKNLQKVQQDLYSKVGLKYNPLGYNDVPPSAPLSIDDAKKKIEERKRTMTLKPAAKVSAPQASPFQQINSMFNPHAAGDIRRIFQ